MPLVLITDYMGNDTTLEESLFSRAGVDVAVAPAPDPPTWLEVAEDADAILTGQAPLHASTIDRLRRCRVIARYGSGHDNIDIARAAHRGIVVTNVPGYATEEVADHAIALLLAAARYLPAYAASVRGGGWTPRLLPPVQRLRGRRLGLLGCGRIGSAVVERMSPFGVDIAAYDPGAQGLPGGVQRAHTIDRLVDGADFLSLHAPLTPETERCIDARRIGALAPGAVIINVARGGLLDVDAAIRGLESGHLAGLAVDVVDEEPLPREHPLRSLNGAIVTPHVAYFSQTSVTEAKQRSVAEILAVLDGHPPQHPVVAATGGRGRRHHEH